MSVHRWALVLHGGAGVINGEDKEANERALEGLRQALAAGLNRVRRDL